MTHDNLATHVSVFRQVRERLAAEFGLGADDEAILDTAEGETDLADILTRLLREARLAEAKAAGIATLQKEMTERRTRLQERGDKLRAIVLHAMADAGLPKLMAPDFSASVGRSQPRLVVPDDDAVPDDMCRHKREPDKTKIAAALKEAHADGRAFNYAYFADPAETLTIRGK